MDIHKVIISRAKLKTIPENERLLLIEIGHLLNEINTLQKVIFIASRHTEEQLERRGRNLQALFFVRILVGKLYEAWEALKRDFFGAKLSKEYEGLFSSEGKQSLDKLKKYFSTRNLINRIRNDFAFHLASPKDLENQLRKIPSNESFEMWISPEHGNCLYSMSDVILNFSLLNTVHPGMNPNNPDDLSKAMDKVLEETFTVTRQFLDVLSECTVVIADKLGLNSELVEIREPPALENLVLPYFVQHKEKATDNAPG